MDCGTVCEYKYFSLNFFFLHFFYKITHTYLIRSRFTYFIIICSSFQSKKKERKKNHICFGRACVWRGCVSTAVIVWRDTVAHEKGNVCLRMLRCYVNCLFSQMHVLTPIWKKACCVAATFSFIFSNAILASLCSQFRFFFRFILTIYFHSYLTNIFRRNRFFLQSIWLKEFELFTAM